MCNICGIVSEKFRPQSAYWEKMCGYITQSKVITLEGNVASGAGDVFVKVINGEKYFAIVDGKINNCNALKSNLLGKGIVCETDKFAELVLMCYCALGESCIKLFKGEFSIIVYDGCTKELFMVRDRVGMNTLFYYFDGSRLAYATEIKAILQIPFVKKALCDDIYCRLFALAGSRGCGETLFLNINEIPPGYYVRYKECKIEVKNYHVFSVRNFADEFKRTESTLANMLKNKGGFDALTEKTMTKEQLWGNIKKYIEISDFPSPYVDLKSLSNLGCSGEFVDFTGIFCAPERFKLPSKWCKMRGDEFVSEFLSTLPWFEYKDERDILKKENVYIKQYIVLPQVVYARKKMCKNLMFPFMDEDVVEYSLQSLDYLKRLSKLFFKSEGKKNTENYKNVKALFHEMISGVNAMSGLIDREEILKFTRLFPRPETMLYFLQVDLWLEKYI